MDRRETGMLKESVKLTNERPDQAVNGASLVKLLHASRSHATAEQFQAAFFEYVAVACQANAALIWIYDGASQLNVLYQRGLEQTSLGQDVEARQRHGKAIVQVARQQSPAALPPQWGLLDADSDTAANPTDMEALLVPLAVTDERFAVVEVLRSPSETREVQNGSLQRLRQIGELVVDHLRGLRWRRIEELHKLQKRLADFSARVHTSLDLREVAYAIANDGRCTIGCDRLSVVVCHGSKSRLEAVSGEDVVNHRSNLVKSMERLAGRVIQSGTPFAYASNEGETIEGVAQSILDEYPLESRPQSVYILPLLVRVPDNGLPVPSQHSALETGEPVGALIVEQFSADIDVTVLQTRAQAVAPHCLTSLQNCRQHQQIFLLPLWQRLGSAYARIRAIPHYKLLLFIGILAALICALTVVPRQLRISGEGLVRAQERHGVFAPEDGIVRQVLVHQGDHVEKGEPLVVLENIELSVQLRETRATLVRAKVRLGEKEAERDASRQSTATRITVAGEVAELEGTVPYLTERLKLIEQRVDRLTVRAPMTGLVTTWLPEQSLMNRPVQRGERLLQTAATTGPWILDVNVPEDEAGYLLRRNQALKSDERIAVEYVLATQPEQHYRGRVREISPSSHLKDGASVVLVTVVPDTERLPPLREGAEVKAKFLCGERAVGFVWFREVFEFVQTRILF